VDREYLKKKDGLGVFNIILSQDQYSLGEITIAIYNFKISRGVETIISFGSRDKHEVGPWGSTETFLAFFFS